MGSQSIRTTDLREIAPESSSTTALRFVALISSSLPFWANFVLRIGVSTEAFRAGYSSFWESSPDSLPTSLADFVISEEAFRETLFKHWGKPDA